MLRIVIRALGITFVTVACLSLVVERQSRREDAQSAALGLPTVAADETSAPGDAPASPIAALRAMLTGSDAPPPTEAPNPPEPEGPGVHRGVPSGAGDVRVNRGLP